MPFFFPFFLHSTSAFEDGRTFEGQSAALMLTRMKAVSANLMVPVLDGNIAIDVGASREFRHFDGPWDVTVGFDDGRRQKSGHQAGVIEGATKGPWVRRCLPPNKGTRRNSTVCP